ncbi:MAG: ComF family protein [Gammaproteobacteria bacterium]
MVNDWSQAARFWLFPPTCALCDGASYQGLDLCNGCYRDLPRIRQACTRCAAPISLTGRSLVCGNCQRKPPCFQGATAPFQYQQPLVYLIHQLKFARQLSIARLLGRLMIEHFANWPGLPDCLIPVPLHPKRLRERGFNQAMEISRVLGKGLNVPVLKRSCRRVRCTVAQSLLPVKKRRANVRNAFQVHGSLKEQHVAIVDDVLTTGNTANELARCLISAGAKRVEVWVVARAGQ